MKKIFKLLCISLLIASCSKNEEVPPSKPLKNIAGIYEADAKYHYSKDGYVIDTVYKTSFEITEQDSDTIYVKFLSQTGAYSSSKLYFMPNQPSEDTLLYERPYNYYQMINFYFYKKSRKFLYKYSVSFTGASGFGGITHTIRK